ncbi:MAG: Uncharacterized protein G01um101419_720 [Parcubacteria group bacterium Gr01-1014_19]|nr:MAG: Uncharacterized protein G01um101419_720 [Parcubacteria group bacterium Gr01-1014_19]
MSKEKFEQKEAVSEKQNRWNELEAEVDQIGDKLGMGVDRRIKPVVRGLMANGFQTTMSCEGHVNRDDHGYPWPWVTIESPLSAEVKKNRRFDFLDNTASLKDGWNNMSEKDRKEWQKFKDVINEADGKEDKRLKKILDEFYKDEKGNRPERIGVDSGHVWPKEMLELWSRIKGKIIDVHKTWPKEEKKKKLELYQQEFKRFAEFLKERFFREK